MKLYIFIFTIIVIIATSCQKKDFNLGTKKDFKANVEYYTSDQDFGFIIYNIEDSRCPVSMDCTWEGEALIKIKSVKPKNDTIILSTYDNLIDTLLNYKFSLIEVNPYPQDENQIDLKDYRVKMLVEEL